ncbi:ATP-binding cassette domain-containing protein [Pseudomonas sp. NW5]|uniref:ATP-binding cassette domain-containing protein n=1 Tax=Pseudomonas sp. NW5 TaxID=2934934 RepID=UPI0020212F61|nr:ATP-binding cassette domain-containing protein [Pseudomonas sp. NW5]MCL7462834.1 ATP-binding cassette domain-containing protein [Pseudomonas sp. NW5]
MTTAAPVLELHDLRFAWPGQPLLLDVPHLRLEAGERLFLQGASGSGKSTLLGLLGGVQMPQGGRVCLLGHELGRLRAGQRDRLRVDHSGFLFQQFNLLPFLDLCDNVTLPCRFSALRRQRACQRHGSVNAAAHALLARLGLDGALLARRVDQLSIGQQQRVAAARALIGQPELLIADEPTSALDAQARQAFIELLLEECRAAGASLLFVSHDHSLAGHFTRCLDLATLNHAARSL